MVCSSMCSNVPVDGRGLPRHSSVASGPPTVISGSVCVRCNCVPSSSHYIVPRSAMIPRQVQDECYTYRLFDKRKTSDSSSPPPRSIWSAMDSLPWTYLGESSKGQSIFFFLFSFFSPPLLRATG